MRGRAAAALLLLVAARSHAQVQVRIADLGPGASGRLLQQALERPHVLVEPDTGWYVVPRSERVPTTVVVLGRDAAVSGVVAGDVIVAGGDLFVRPGAHIEGRGIAIGGGVYPSALATVDRGTMAFRDNTFTIARTNDGYRLAYRSLYGASDAPLLFPGVYGLRMPAYDRVNGLSLPFGPAVSFDTGRAEVSALATYRSDLGAVDPSVHGRIQLTRRLRFTADAARGTFTNDSWIWSDFVNSLSALVYGADTRNYFRADRARVTAHRLWETTAARFEPFVGAVVEHAWSVGPARGEARGPWSVLQRDDSLGMWRPNPPVQAGNLASVVAGSSLEWSGQDVVVTGQVGAEAPWHTPGGQHFVQVTSNADVTFPTFGEQTYALDVHWLTTFGDTPPPQRFGYLGGSGTLPFVDLLSQGGDELLLVDQRYKIPVPAVSLGLLGVPTVLLRHRMGAAGVGRMASLEQMLGLGLEVTILRAEVDFDPARHRVRASAGFSFAR